MKTAVPIGVVHFALAAAFGVFWGLGTAYRPVMIGLAVTWVLGFVLVQSVIGRDGRLTYLPRRIRRGLILGAITVAVVAIVFWAAVPNGGGDQTPKRVALGVLFWMALGLGLFSSNRVLAQAPAAPEPARSLRGA